MPNPLRIFYAAGPGDILGTYGHWKAGRDDPSQVAMTYSGQFFDRCRELHAEGYAVSYCPRTGYLHEGNLRIEHRPLRFKNGPGPLYHIGQVWSGFRMAVSAWRFGADLAVVSDGAHWFSLGLMSLLGVKVVPTLHCVLWPKHREIGLIPRLVRRLNARFFRKRASAVMSLSDDITSQVKDMVGSTDLPIIPFLPSYRPSAFADMAPPVTPSGGLPFRVFFAGRIERNKGVFDLLSIAQRFKTENRTDIEFDLCGSGASLDELKEQCRKAGLENVFRLHGHAPKPVMRKMFEQSHVVIAPTTVDFIEGFNKVVAEGVLAGRPVITSSVCPALSYVREAVVEVAPNDVKAYGDAILRLRDDASFYESKRQGSVKAQSQFYDLERSWGAALRQAVKLTCEPRG